MRSSIFVVVAVSTLLWKWGPVSRGHGGAAQGVGATEVADRSCQVVLRSLSRIAKNGGYETGERVQGSCWLVWSGRCRLDEGLESLGAVPVIQYKNQDDAQWSRASGSKTEGAPEGYVRYHFRLVQNTVTSGMLTSSFNNARIEIAPFAQLSSGKRLFDYNRHAGEFDNYQLMRDTQAPGSDRRRGLSGASATAAQSHVSRRATHGATRCAGGRSPVHYQLRLGTIDDVPRHPQWLPRVGLESS